MNYTVLENIKNGSRFFSSYHTDFRTDLYRLVAHVETIEDAQALCDVRRNENINAFMSNLPDSMPKNLKKLTKQLLDK